MTALLDVDREGVGPVRRRAVRGGDSAARADPRRGIRTTSTRRCGWRPRTRRSATTRRRWRSSSGRRRSRRSRQDVRTYLALHYARTKDWDARRAAARAGGRRDAGSLAALEALAVASEQGDVTEAIGSGRRSTRSARHRRGARAARRAGHGGGADGRRRSTAFEGARALQGASFTHDLELGRPLPRRRGASRRRGPRSTACRRRSPDYPMALFKRAQVSVLLHEPDARARIERGAEKERTQTTRPLIERETAVSTVMQKR